MCLRPIDRAASTAKRPWPWFLAYMTAADHSRRSVYYCGRVLRVCREVRLTHVPCEQSGPFSGCPMYSLLRGCRYYKTRTRSNHCVAGWGIGIQYTATDAYSATEQPDPRPLSMRKSLAREVLWRPLGWTSTCVLWAVSQVAEMVGDGEMGVVAVIV